MRALILNISFFTRLPLAKLAPYSDDRYKASIKFFPYVGLIIGGIMVLPNLLGGLPTSYVAVLNILVYLWISGGIHLDGFSDSLDGLLSGRTGERVFEIMKDSRMGAFGTIGIGLYLLILFVFLQGMPISVLWLTPYFSKLCASVVAGISNYPQGKSGMGSWFLIINTPLTSVVHLAIGIGMALYFGSTLGLLALVISLGMAILARRWHLRILGGLTGDSIGYIVESSWLFYLIAYQCLSLLIM